MTRRSQVLRESLWVYFVTVGLIKLFYELRFLSFVQQYVWTLAILLQVYLPTWFMQRKQLPLTLLGFHTKSWQQGVKFYFLFFLMIFVPSVGGHHLWQLYNHRQLNTSGSPYLQFPMWLRGEPAPSLDPRMVQIFCKEDHPILVIRWGQALSGRIISTRTMRVFEGGQWIQGDPYKKQIEFSAPHSGMLKLWIEGEYAQFVLRRDQKELPSTWLRLGTQDHPPSSGNWLHKDWSWFWHLLLIQLFMVAFPEEFFYRGFLLTWMDRRWPVHRWCGIPISWGNLIVSFLFALTHYLIGFQFYRWGVFFPSLLFGALRQHTGSLLAPVLLHASANILMRCLELWYQ